MKLKVQVDYSFCNIRDVDLPAGRTEQDLREAEVWVKWDTLHIVFADGEKFEQELDSNSTDAVDWKMPCAVEIATEDETKILDWEN